jgi:ferritin
MKRSLKDFKSDLEYLSIAYYRSQITFDALRDFMGDKKFNKLLKEIIKKYKFQTINTQNLYKLANKIKRGSENLLENYVNGSTKIG